MPTNIETSCEWAVKENEKLRGFMLKSRRRRGIIAEKGHLINQGRSTYGIHPSIVR